MTFALARQVKNNVTNTEAGIQFARRLIPLLLIRPIVESTGIQLSDRIIIITD